MEKKDISASPQDLARLWTINPVAREQLHWIVLERLLDEAEKKDASASIPS